MQQVRASILLFYRSLFGADHSSDLSIGLLMWRKPMEDGGLLPSSAMAPWEGARRRFQTLLCSTSVGYCREWASISLTPNQTNRRRATSHPTGAAQ